MKRNYKCIITSPSRWRRVYTVQTSSAYKAAQFLARYDGGEQAEIYTMSGKLISTAIYSSELHDFFRCARPRFDEYIDVRIFDEE